MRKSIYSVNLKSLFVVSVCRLFYLFTVLDYSNSSNIVGFVYSNSSPIVGLVYSNSSPTVGLAYSNSSPNVGFGARCARPGESENTLSVQRPQPRTNLTCGV